MSQPELYMLMIANEGGKLMWLCESQPAAYTLLQRYVFHHWTDGFYDESGKPARPGLVTQEDIDDFFLEASDGEYGIEPADNPPVTLMQARRIPL